jgi:hypothetical protein
MRERAIKERDDQRKKFIQNKRIVDDGMRNSVIRQEERVSQLENAVISVRANVEMEKRRKAEEEKAHCITKRLPRI